MSRTPIELDGVTPVAPTDFHPPRARHRAATLFSPLRSSSTPASLSSLHDPVATLCDRESRAILSQFPLLLYSSHLFHLDLVTRRFVEIDSTLYSSYAMRLQANLLTTIFMSRVKDSISGEGDEALSLSLLG